MENSQKSQAVRNDSIFIIASAALLLAAAGAYAEQVSPVVITCLGDSVTEGAGSGGSQYTYPSQMEPLLDEQFPDKTFEVHNRGVGGYRAENVRSLLQTQGLPENPQFVLLMIGGNDIAAAMNDWGLIGQIIDETVAEVQDCVDLIKAHTNPDGSHPTLILSTFIPNRIEESAFWGSLGTLAISWYNDDLKADISGEDMTLETNWQDLWQAYGLYGRANPAYMSDTVHPNATGYGIMAQNWFEAICTFPSMKDSDGDGLYDAEESSYGINPQNADTDGDGMSDLVEVKCAGAAVANDPNAKPETIMVNFQPLRTLPPAGYLPDGGLSLVPAKGFGWQ